MTVMGERGPNYQGKVSIGKTSPFPFQADRRYSALHRCRKGGRPSFADAYLSSIISRHPSDHTVYKPPNSLPLFPLHFPNLTEGTKTTAQLLSSFKNVTLLVHASTILPITCLAENYAQLSQETIHKELQVSKTAQARHTDRWMLSTARFIKE